MEKVKEKIELLRMRSNTNQQKVIDIDEKMKIDLQSTANGRILEILRTYGKQSARRKKRNPWIDGDTKKYGF
jgi:hypothetical protein